MDEQSAMDAQLRLMRAVRYALEAGMSVDDIMELVRFVEKQMADDNPADARE